MDVEVDDKKMVEKQKEEVLLAYDKEKKTVVAVKGVDEKGALQTIPTKPTNNNEFLKLDRNGDILSNFLSNFNSQLKDPTQFNFFNRAIVFISKIKIITIRTDKKTANSDIVFWYSHQLFGAQQHYRVSVSQFQRRSSIA